MTKKTDNLPVARMANEFAIEGNFSFQNAREWLIFLYLVGQLDPIKQRKLPPQIVIPVIDLKNILISEKKYAGAFHERIRKLTERMASSYCKFTTDVSVEGKKLFRYVPIFQEIGAVYSADGTASLVFEFNFKMTPILIGLKKNFLSIKPPTNIKSGHAINFLLYAKAERDKKRKHDGQTTVIRIGVDELKLRLNIPKKYPRFNSFKDRVIIPIKDGVNKSGVINISNIEYEKTARTVHHILFFVQDTLPILETQLKTTIANTEPTTAEIEALSYAQKRAVKFLVKKGIYEGIAIRKIIPMMPSSLCEGYEDYFCEEIYQIVEEKSKAKDAKGRAAILVDWFKKDIFKNDHFSRIIENVHSRKKKLNQVQSMNREAAKNMTANEFVAWTKTQKTTAEEENQTPSTTTKSIGKIIKEKYRTK